MQVLKFVPTTWVSQTMEIKLYTNLKGFGIKKDIYRKNK